MNNNKKNQYLEMFLNIADELLENHHIKSRRDFSSRYLNKCSNYLGSLVWQNKKPSISSSWALLVNLHKINYYHNGRHNYQKPYIIWR